MTAPQHPFVHARNPLETVLGSVAGFSEKYGHKYLTENYYGSQKVENTLKPLREAIEKNAGELVLVAKYQVNVDFPNDTPPYSVRPWKVWLGSWKQSAVWSEDLLDFKVARVKGFHHTSGREAFIESDEVHFKNNSGNWTTSAEKIPLDVDSLMHGYSVLPGMSLVRRATPEGLTTYRFGIGEDIRYFFKMKPGVFWTLLARKQGRHEPDEAFTRRFDTVCDTLEKKRASKTMLFNAQ